jgi:hypothetical protein
VEPWARSGPRDERLRELAQANSSAGSRRAAAGTGARKGAAQAVWAGSTRRRRTKKGKKLLFA